ncbi:MAG: prolyl oligopeptidase family serine peptidase [Anaerolineales bacterium]|nr:prolyl oligopeptidase family serine peptidase [Anaerolineales bacterium]
MKRILLSLLALTFSLLACARTVPATPTDSTQSIMHDGIERTYILHVPASYDEDEPTPLVLAFHGGGGNAENQRRTSGFNDLADEKGFIVVYPNGSGRLEDAILTWNGGTCCGYASTNQIDDVGFVRAVIAELQAEYNIDPKRIYATGMSNGGIMSYRLACDAADIFAAIGPVSGTQNYAQCNPSEPVSVIHFHGTDDTHLPYDGGVGDDSLTQVIYTSVEESVNFWLDVDQCAKTPQTANQPEVRIDAYDKCAQGSAVHLYTIIGGKHAWPGSDGPGWVGGDEPSQAISASDIIWEFFAAHPKP